MGIKGTRSYLQARPPPREIQGDFVQTTVTRCLAACAVGVVFVLLAGVTPARADVMYVSNYLGGGTISKVSSTGQVSTYATGIGYASGLVRDASGDLYVSELTGGSIIKIAAGGVKSNFATKIWGFQIAFGPDGALYTASRNLDAIKRITAAGVVNDFVTNISAYQLAFDSSGYLFTVDNTRIGMLQVNPAGVVSNYIAVPQGMTGLAFAPDGTLYGANYLTGSVYKLTSQGASVFATGFVSPQGIAFDSNGDLYVANQNANSISKVTSAGVVSTFATGLNAPQYIAFAVPEPASGLVVMLAVVSLTARRRRMNRVSHDR